MPIGGVLVAAAVVLLPACRERPRADAAEAPRLEIKAEIAPPRTATVVAPLDGRVSEVRAAEGALVRAGDVLLTLSNPSVERDLAQMKIQLAIAERRLAGAGGRRRSTGGVSRADDAIRAAEQIVRSRKNRLDRYEALFRTRDISADDLENARLEHAAALRDLAAMRQSRDSAGAVALADPELLRLEVEKARLDLAVVEGRQRQMSVTAPMSGRARLRVASGDLVFPRDPLVDITDATTLDVRGSIAPELLRHIRAGAPVEVKVFSVPPRRFAASVRTVVPPSDPGGAALLVAVPNPDSALQPGTPAMITVR
jgi:multidrug resistance efflux pump